MINYRRDATVGVELGVFRSFVLALAKVQVDRLVGQAELFEDDGDLPAQRISADPALRKSDKPAVGARYVGVKSKLFAVRHGEVWVGEIRGCFSQDCRVESIYHNGDRTRLEREPILAKTQLGKAYSILLTP